MDDLRALCERYFCAAYFWRLDPNDVLAKTLSELQELEEGSGVVIAALKRDTS